jgi:hypothetical protein
MFRLVFKNGDVDSLLGFIAVFRTKYGKAHTELTSQKGLF